MIPREDYRGPLTKSAQAMFARAERRKGLAGAPPPPTRRVGGRKKAGRSPAERALAEIGMTRARLRQWEDFGLITLDRAPGRHRVVDAQVIEHLRLICALRRCGLSLREIAWLSPEGPPTADRLRRELALFDPQARTVGGSYRASATAPSRVQSLLACL